MVKVVNLLQFDCLHFLYRVIDCLLIYRVQQSLKCPWSNWHSTSPRCMSQQNPTTCKLQFKKLRAELCNDNVTWLIGLCGLLLLLESLILVRTSKDKSFTMESCERLFCQRSWNDLKMSRYLVLWRCEETDRAEWRQNYMQVKSLPTVTDVSQTASTFIVIVLTLGAPDRWGLLHNDCLKV